MADAVRRKCFISYHKDDRKEVEAFIKKFDEEEKVFISRSVGVSDDDQDLIDSENWDYVMKRIREKYLTDSTVTIVLIGKCTWSRRFVDWEIASTLRDDPNNKRSGLMAITLPSIANSSDKKLPPRLDDNVDGEKGYARWWKYPGTADQLRNLIEIAFDARTSKEDLVNNGRERKKHSSHCE
ncbi:MAG: TIR domain-containing protein [Armatimonadota bacterium]|nr:TIR domain-containing protein [Armatimonadota bacterium]